MVGGGFGGLQAALHLARLPVNVTLIDRRNFHLFQPLAYQVATGALSPAEIAYPLRRVFRRRSNVDVLLAEVTDFDLDSRRVQLASVAGEHAPDSITYDMLIVSGGSRYNYFGHDGWEDAAPNLKSLEGALTLRRRILEAFEAAELERDSRRRAAWLTFVVVGGGPTGVEMAGQLAEIARDLRRDFRSLDSTTASILLVEAGDQVLREFPDSLCPARDAVALTSRRQRPPSAFGRRGRRGVGHRKRRRRRTGRDRRPDRHLGGGGRGLGGQHDARAPGRTQVDGAGRVEVLPDLSLPAIRRSWQSET